MKLEFKYTNELVNSLLKIEKYKTALDYLLLPTREKQKLMYEAKLKKTHFSTSIEGNVLSYNQVERVIANKKDNRITAEQEVQNYWDALTYLEEEKKKNTKIEMYQDKIIISSPGGLDGDMTKEDYIKGNYSYLRNPIIANVFRRLNIIEKRLLLV